MFYEVLIRCRHIKKKEGKLAKLYYSFSSLLLKSRRWISWQHMLEMKMENIHQQDSERREI